CVVEVTAERGKELLGHVDRGLRHRGGVLDHELLERREGRARLVRRELSKLRLADAGRPADGRADVDSERAADECSRLEEGKRLESRFDAAGTRERGLEARVGPEDLRVVRRDRDGRYDP